MIRNGPFRTACRNALIGLVACAGLVATAAEAHADPLDLGPSGLVSLEVSRGRVIKLDEPVTAVFVADPEIADVQAQSPTVIYLFGRKAGTTSLYAVNENDDLLVRSEVTVTHNVSRLQSVIEELAPRGGITVTSIDNGIVLEGEVSDPTAAQEIRELAQRFLGQDESLVNRMQVSAPTQIHLRVRVAEIEREVIKNFGVNWRAVLETGDFLFGLATGREIGRVTNGFIDRGLVSNRTSDAFAFQYRDSDLDINSIVDALEDEGLIKVLAEPNLTAVSGETASFLAGGEFPIPVGVDDNEIEIQFKEFGVSLSFTPTVLNRKRISLSVRPEVSELSDQGAIIVDDLVIPALRTRRAQTTVELASGQSFAIGGLMRDDVRTNVDKFAGLADVPILGPLFRSQNFRRNESELVIIVTPYVVRPVSAPNMAVPTDGYRAPSDLERILNGRLHSASVGRGAAPAVGTGGLRLVGPAGFVIE